MMCLFMNEGIIMQLGTIGLLASIVFLASMTAYVASIYVGLPVIELIPASAL